MKPTKKKIKSVKRIKNRDKNRFERKLKRATTLELKDHSNKKEKSFENSILTSAAKSVLKGEKLIKNKESTKFETKKEDSKYSQSDIKEGKTLFIQNLPFDATDSKLKLFFTSKGYKVVQAKVVLSKTTGKDQEGEICKGSGFIKCISNEEASKLEIRENGSLFDNRPLRILKALEKSAAPTFSDVSTSANKNDSTSTSILTKRNIHLLKIGNLRDSKTKGILAQFLPSELKRYKQDRKEQNQKAQFNTNTVVCPYRICVQNLSNKITEKDLVILVHKSITKWQYTKDITCYFTKSDSMKDNKKEAEILSKITTFPLPKIRLVCDKKTGKSKQFAFIQFPAPTTETVDVALTVAASRLPKEPENDLLYKSFNPHKQKTYANKIFCLTLYCLFFLNARNIQGRRVFASFAIDDLRALHRQRCRKSHFAAKLDKTAETTFSKNNKEKSKIKRVSPKMFANKKPKLRIANRLGNNKKNKKNKKNNIKKGKNVKKASVNKMKKS